MDINTFKDTFHLDLESTTPLYQQLYDYFKRLILTGALKEGDQMLPEIIICDSLDISRSTVRKTMEMLIEDGYLIRKRGKGSFISSPKLKRNINYLYNFSENMENIGVSPSSSVIECAIVDHIDEKIRNILQLPQSNTKVFLLKRIRKANGVPILCESTYIPYYLCPGIETYDFTSQSLYTILSKKYFLDPFHATESIEAVFLSQKDKELLNCDQEIPGFKITRLSYTKNEEILEYTTSITRADKCIFMMELYKNSNNNTVPVQIQRNLNI